MFCRINDMREKEVININDGERLGTVGDIEIDTSTGKLISIIIFSHKWLGVIGKSEDVVIFWNDIQVIGDDTILVSFDKSAKETPKYTANFPKLLNE